MAKLFDMAVTGICFSGQDTRTMDWLSGEFHVLQQMPGWLKSKGEHCKLEPFLPTKTIQEELCCSIPALGNWHQHQAVRTIPTVLNPPVPCQCPAAEASMGAFPSSFKLALPGVFLFLGSGFQELVEPVTFYVQGCGQRAPPQQSVLLSL